MTLADGSAKTVIRSQVITVDTTAKAKEAKTIEGGVVQDVSGIERLQYYPKKNSSKVKFDLPDVNNSYNDDIKANELKASKLLEHSKIELKYFKNLNSRYHQDPLQHYSIYF
jgi:hypothetical protein